ncbi:energy transducer TonB [Pseudomonas sp. dw_358]|uniref:energy transducer TonB n=1 Tax=Pseudomonas sp. dw_358 TaxID=2720083 RepID=UPI001BD5D6BB|nr:energy transducer TonB [Pseudomonas sp. dw_358]
MLNEPRRRAYLDAMQVVPWLPRTELPFAAPSRAWLLEPLVQPETALPSAPALPAVPAPGTARTVERSRIEVPRPTPKSVAEPVVGAIVVEKAPAVPAPRFALQLLRAGVCLILAELPTGQPFQSRDPSYLLLKDLLRAAGLPDSPQIIGEPVRWPLLQRGNLDQGPDAARDFVQGFVQAQLELAPCLCLWLVGLPAVRFAGEGNAEDYDCELQVESLGNAWALPSLELLMDEPQRKASLWRAMRRLMPRWKHREE